MSDRFASRLATEAPRWVRDGLISAAQADRLLARHPVASGWLSRPIVLFALLGGGLIAAAIALVVAHNWASIHRWMKLGGLFAIMVFLYAGGLALRERGRTALADGLLLLAGALVMIAIALIGQIYHLSGRPADAVLLWWVLLLPAAYVLPSIGLGLLATGALIVWYGLALVDRTTRLGAAVHDSPYGALIAIAAFGITLFAVGILHAGDRYRPVGRLLEIFGLLGAFGGLLELGFDWRAPTALGAPSRSVAVLSVVLGIPLIAVVAVWAALPRDTRLAQAGFIAIPVVLLLYLVALELLLMSRTPVDVTSLPPVDLARRVELARPMAFINWFLVFAAPLALILYGARWGRSAWINVGVLALGVHAVARFVDLFGTMLETSALFFAAGVFVLGLGWALERVRRRMTARAASAETA